MATALINGHSVAVTLAQGAGEQFSIAVPAGAENLVVTLSDLTADLDLYVKFGVEASQSSQDAASTSGGTSTETCTFPTPSAGTYYIFAYGYAAGSGSVTAAFTDTGTIPPVAGRGTVHAPSTPFAFVPAIHGLGALRMNPEQVSAVIPVVTGAGRTPRPATTWALTVDQLPAVQTVFTLTLTGAANGLPDIVLPMSSFQSRLNADAVHYLSAVVPNSRKWADAVAARTGGAWIVRKGYRRRDGSTALAEIVRVAFSNLAWDRGTTGDSATVYGESTVAVAASKSVVATGVQYEALDTSGKRRIRCEVSLFMAPGDLCIWSGGSMVVGEIVHYVGESMSFMEVTEA